MAAVALVALAAVSPSCARLGARTGLGGPADHAAAATRATGATGPRWRPGVGPLPWQWELDHEIDLANPADAGAGDRTPTGARAVAPSVYDVDGFDTTAADVRAIHARGAHAICYVEVGASEGYRPDAGRFPAADLGRGVDGYPAERYLDIRAAAVVRVVEARIRMCAAKGFDGVEPDIDDSYTDATGFPITEADDIAYDRSLARYAAGLGLAWGLKNGADGGSPGSFVSALLPSVQFAVVEEPFYLHTLRVFEPRFDRAGKAVFVAEYTDDTTRTRFAADCRQPAAAHVDAALFDVALDGRVRVPCR